MNRLPKPNLSAAHVFSTCISKVKNARLRARLIAIRNDVNLAASDYDVSATAGAWYLIPRTGSVKRVTKEELMKIYKSRMAKQGSPGRPIYDSLMIVPQKRCPLCGHRDVSTLDHYLPESCFTLLVVTPYNLIPACRSCNFAKLSAVPDKPENQTIHPYYDDFGDAVWLEAQILATDPITVTFSVMRPAGWAKTKFFRAQHHFKLFGLEALYSDNAAGELTDMRHLLIELFSSGGKKAVSRHLRGFAASISKIRKNSWRSALYESAAASDWFCDQGFMKIAASGNV